MKEDTYHLGVKAIIHNDKNEILLLKVNLAKLKGTNKEYWDIPGGRVMRGSTVEKTLLRELEEETGINKVNKITPFTMVLSNIRIPADKSDVGLILASYICEVDTNQKTDISDEHVEYRWFNPKQAAELLAVKYPPEFTKKLNDLHGF